MRWRTPETGNRRERVIFAFTPRETRQGTTVWLERVKVTEKYFKWDNTWEEIIADEIPKTKTVDWLYFVGILFIILGLTIFIGLCTLTPPSQ